MNGKRSKRNKRFMRISFVVGITLAMIGVVASCDNPTDAPTTSASCAFVIGDGLEGRDAVIHDVLYPGQEIRLDRDGSGTVTELVRYVPCNSRTFIINNGTVKNANGNLVGDRFNPIAGYTNTGTKVLIQARADWTLNQDERSMRDFYTVCFKFSCASGEDQGGGANFSTEGWNGMLGEIHSAAMDGVGLTAAFTVNDDVWQKHDPKLYEELGKVMTESFADEIRKYTGFPQDLFCGSGNSGWKNPEKPGEGEFTCTPVRLTVTSVDRAPVDKEDSSSESARNFNSDRLDAAKALYGDAAGYWLGVQDSIEKCRDRATCVVNIGGANSNGVTLPSPAPTSGG